MSLIKDVKYELQKLDASAKQLRKFGLTFSILCIIVLAYFYINDSSLVSNVLLVLSSIVFLLFAVISPLKLRLLYKCWMGIAFFLGWVVSRIILTILFVIVITPIAFLIKIAKKQFLDLDIGKLRSTNWKNKFEKRSNIEKMY